MLYVKQSFGYADVTTEIRDDNVFAKCDKCGCEVSVDITKVFDGDNDLHSKMVLCDNCSLLENCNEDGITNDDLSELAFMIFKSGHSKALLRLYQDYRINSVDDLSLNDFTDFYVALTDIESRGSY